MVEVLDQCSPHENFGVGGMGRDVRAAAQNQPLSELFSGGPLKVKEVT